MGKDLANILSANLMSVFLLRIFCSYELANSLLFLKQQSPLDPDNFLFHSKLLKTIAHVAENDPSHHRNNLTQQLLCFHQLLQQPVSVDFP